MNLKVNSNRRLLSILLFTGNLLIIKWFICIYFFIAYLYNKKLPMSKRLIVEIFRTMICGLLIFFLTTIIQLSSANFIILQHEQSTAKTADRIFINCICKTKWHKYMVICLVIFTGRECSIFCLVRIWLPNNLKSK